MSRENTNLESLSQSKKQCYSRNSGQRYVIFLLNDFSWLKSLINGLIIANYVVRKTSDQSKDQDIYNFTNVYVTFYKLNQHMF